jgi:hypothetical protein
MKLFQRREYYQALECVAQGEQALLVHAWGGPSEHKCFHGAPEIGKLMDADVERLIRMAKSLGVVRIVVCRKDQRGQHIDLVGRPLERGKRLCEQAQEKGLV